MGKTRGVHETTPELRNRMVGMYEAGLGPRDIAIAVNCSQRTVKRWLNRFDKEGTVETRERRGRKRATTSEQDEAIIQLAIQNPITAAKTVLPALGLSCSVDTIRDRLHKAGIHNWSPSRKHIQRIPLGDADGVAIQQAVWRPTGTQLGKKKILKCNDKIKNKIDNTNIRSTKKKKKLPVKKTIGNDNISYVDERISTSSHKQSVIQSDLTYTQYNAEIDDVPVQSMTIDNANNNNTINNRNSHHQIQFNNPLELAESSLPLYENHSQINDGQNWPLDLVQSNHHQYPQNQQQSSNSTPPHLHELNSQPRNQENIHIEQNHHNHHLHHHDQPQQQIHHHQHEIHTHINQSIENSINSSYQKIDKTIENHSNNIDTNSNSSNDVTEITKDNYDNCQRKNSKQNDGKDNLKKKRSKRKGGKAKGTLETSVELRNRMIGMSEAGLSNLSIALAINRSQRTVKRWLERWNKEGNVQTKERKGRKRITTKEQDDAIIAMATQQPLTAAKNVAPALGLNCSVDTIRERLHKAGIHSWKLGKQQGEGNGVHTVHLWQPSGNRPNKPKPSNERKKKSPTGKKRTETNKITSTITKKYTLRKKNIVSTRLKIARSVSPSSLPTQTNIIPEQDPLQFHNPGTDYAANSSMMQSVEIPTPMSLVMSTSETPPPAPIVPLGPEISQVRPDCRMTTSSGASGTLISAQTNSSLDYSSCMIANNNNHTTHMDHQPDPLNYEPYIWNF